MTTVAQALDRGRAAEAEQGIVGLLALYPDHAEILRLYAGVQSLRGDFAGAIATMRRAVALRPYDALYHNTLGSSLIGFGHYDEAITVLQRACELDPKLTSAWFNLGLVEMRSMHVNEAERALRRAVSLSPDISLNARALLGDMLRAEGRIDDAITEYRAMIKLRPYVGLAWWGLADLKTRRFSDDEVRELRAALLHPNASEDDLLAMGFALARALDERALYVDSLTALSRANARARTRIRWDANAHVAYVDAILQAFAPPPATPDDALGREVIFVASMPRSGSTLFEQVLASHSQVDGAGELADLQMILNEESNRRGGVPFVRWIKMATSMDWQRLGNRYLERTAHWRKRRPFHVDKLPSNWLYIGAIRAMLPGARTIVVRRDPLETCFSCYRQRLVNNEYTRTFTDLAAMWRDFDRAIRHWLTLHPKHVHEIVYEEFVASPEATTRKLLAFCELPFESACLQFHRTEREVYTPSALQVREPLRTDTAHTARYGALLDPLRVELGLPRFSAG